MNRTEATALIPDLKALFYFSKVVDYGGFSAAQRAIGIPKSRLSRGMAELEKELGVRLLQRNTRRLALTEVGKLFHEHCRAMMVEAEGAIDAVLKLTSSPRGVVRVSCPVTASQTLLSPVVAGFLKRCPEVTLRVQVTNRVVDLFEDDVDLALRVRSFVDDTAGLIVQRFWSTPQHLVAAKSLLNRHRPANLDDLRKLPSLDLSPRDGRHVWHLKSPDGRSHECVHHPRLITDDMESLRQAALAGLGAVALPEIVCDSDLRSGSLVAALPGWALPKHQLYAAFLSRRGLMPGVKHFLEYLSESFSDPRPSIRRRDRTGQK
jgi:DNA-binding transcriptional LysR family regulator